MSFSSRPLWAPSYCQYKISIVDNTYGDRAYLRPGNWTVLAATLFGFSSYETTLLNQECVAVTVTISRWFSIRMPSCYANHLAEAQLDTSQMISQVVSIFHGGPKIVHLRHDKDIDLAPRTINSGGLEEHNLTVKNV